MRDLLFVCLFVCFHVNACTIWSRTSTIVVVSRLKYNNNGSAIYCFHLIRGVRKELDVSHPDTHVEGRLQPKVDVRKRADAWVAFDSETMYMYMYTIIFDIQSVQ